MEVETRKFKLEINNTILKSKLNKTFGQYNKSEKDNMVFRTKPIYFILWTYTCVCVYMCFHSNINKIREGLSPG